MATVKITNTGPSAREPIACGVCLKEIPKSVAQSYEGPDYVYYFCGAECYEKWRAAAVMPEIGLTVTGCDLDFDAAQRLARALASRQGAEPMLLAWFDRRREQASPNIPECQRLPGWLAYAQGHGGNLKVDINGGEYVFIFVSG
jgi:YHS domain-containing protein